MHTFDVVDRSADRAQLALRCSFGRYHHARPLNALPPVGVSLHGARPHLGFGILVCPESGLIYRVIFESVNGTAPVGVRGCDSSAELPGGKSPSHA